MINPIGYIKIYRELAAKPIWEGATPEQKVILITLLLMANYGDKQWEWKGKQYHAKPGQFVTSLENIAKNAGKGISIKNVRTGIAKFERSEFLTNESASNGRLITIVNWEVYQSDEKNGQSNRQTHGKQGGKHPTNGVATREEVKNIKKLRRDIYRHVQHMELSLEDNTKLLQKYTQEDIDDVLDQMENYAGLKKYKSAYLTANNWLKRRSSDKPSEQSVGDPVAKRARRQAEQVRARLKKAREADDE